MATVYDNTKDANSRGAELSVNRSSVPVVTSDTVDFSSYPKAVTTLTAGTVVCLPLRNTDNAGGLVTLVSLVAGYTLPFRVRRINATGTTATLTASFD
jgi:hypothetical protein